MFLAALEETAVAMEEADIDSFVFKRFSEVDSRLMFGLRTEGRDDVDNLRCSNSESLLLSRGVRK